MRWWTLLFLLFVLSHFALADLPCTESARTCCQYAIRCLVAFGSEVYSSRTGNPHWYLKAPGDYNLRGLPQQGAITVDSVCPKGLARDCPLGYDYFTDVNSEGRNMCKKYDQTLVGHYNPDETVPFNTISDCIATSTVMSYSVDYCLEPYWQAVRHCLFEIGRKG